VGAAKNLDWQGPRDNSTQFTPEKKLAFALLVDALRAIHERTADNKEAFNWLIGQAGYRDDWVFSAESVCESLNIDIAALRARLRHIAALDKPDHRVQRVPVVYKRQPGYREKRGRATHTS
jgi:hypothetical protein